MKPAHVKMWRVWGRSEAEARIYGAHSAAEAARAHAHYCWFRLRWRRWPHLFHVVMDHTSDGAPVDPTPHKVRVFMKVSPEFLSELVA